MVLLAMAACAGSAKRSSNMLYDIRAFNEGLRWHKLPQSAIRIPPALRDDFLDVREALEGDLMIDEYDITRVKTEGREQEEAKVQIKWTWHMDRAGIVKSTTTLQKWKRHGVRWLMLKETFLRGDKMPGVMDDSDDESKDELKDEPGQDTENGKGQSDEDTEALSRGLDGGLR